MVNDLDCVNMKFPVTEKDYIEIEKKNVLL